MISTQKLEQVTEAVAARPPEAPSKRGRTVHQRRQFNQFAGAAGVGVPVDDSARTHRANVKHWARAGGEDANTIIEAQLTTQRNRSRFEIRNNGFAAGMVNTYANDCIGKNGPRLQVVSDDDDFNTEYERCVNEVFEVIGADGSHMVDLLLMNIHQLFESGEFIEQEVSDLTAPTCSSLRLLPIEPDRLNTPFINFADPSFRMGIQIDEATGKPLLYFIMEQHPGRQGPASALRFEKFDIRDADFIIHGFNRTRPGQARGVPWLAPSLDIFGQLRDFRADTLLTAYIQTKFSVLVHSDVENVELDDLDGDLPVWDLEGGSVAFLPEGWKAEGFNPTVPKTNHVEFNKDMLREVGRPVGMPYLKLAADASGHNFSSARLDLQNYWRNVECTQGLLERKKLNRVAKKIGAEARFSGKLRQPPKKGFKLVWIWPAIPQIDPLKEAKAQTERLLNGTSTLARETRQNGADVQEIMAQRARENAEAAELNLPLPHAPSVGGARADVFDIIDDPEQLSRLIHAVNHGGNGNANRGRR